MEMDWGDEEEPKATPRDIWDEDTTPRVKREVSKAGVAPKSAVKNKFADIMAKEPSPPPSPKVIFLPKERNEKYNDLVIAPIEDTGQPGH